MDVAQVSSYPVFIPSQARFCSSEPPRYVAAWMCCQRWPIYQCSQRVNYSNPSGARNNRMIPIPSPHPRSSVSSKTSRVVVNPQLKSNSWQQVRGLVFKIIQQAYFYYRSNQSQTNILDISHVSEGDEAQTPDFHSSQSISRSCAECHTTIGSLTPCSKCDTALYCNDMCLHIVCRGNRIGWSNTC